MVAKPTAQGGRRMADPYLMGSDTPDSGLLTLPPGLLEVIMIICHKTVTIF
jgi:hypothetical protein